MQRSFPEFPGRRGDRLLSAPEGAYFCRAFERIAPELVRVVVLGQDPYPSIAQATGRAFEDGAWDGRRSQDIASSLRPLLLAALATREGHADLFQPGMWPRVRREIERSGLNLPSCREYFDHLEDEGVLFLNAAWTFTRNTDSVRHLRLWEPVLLFLLRKLVDTALRPLVFVLFGGPAKNAFGTITRQGAGIYRIDMDHASRMPLRHNPWLEVNRRFRDAGEREIVWWPPAQRKIAAGGFNEA